MLIQYLVGRGTMDDGIISGIHRKQSTLKSTVGELASERMTRATRGAVLLLKLCLTEKVFPN